MALTRRAAGLVVAVVAVTVAPGTTRSTTAGPEASQVSDGVYLLTFEGEGQKAKLTDGSDAVLGTRLSPSVGVGGTLRSHSNDNTRFTVTVNQLGPLPPGVADVQTALVVDGLVFHLGRPDKLPADGVVNTWANVYTAAAARTLAARYRIEPQLRKHPGHRYEVRWVPGKPQYEADEAVTLKMELKNTGTSPLRFTFGGSQRGPRNNQFRFVAQAGAGGKGLPDTGDARNHGGMVASKTLRPGDVFTAEVDLSKWFAFTEPNTYRVTGVFEMPVVDAASTDGFGPVVWDDLATGECDVRVVGRLR